MKKTIFTFLLPVIFFVALAQGEELGQSHCTTESRINSPSFYDFNKMPVNQVTDYVNQEFIALTDAVMYELQTPIRQDFLKDDFLPRLVFSKD